MPPLVSVIIPTYNCRKYVLSAVNSALLQSMPDLEVIVVDDASTDGTAGLLADVGDDRLTVIRTDVNLGPAGARNLALTHAGGTFVAFLDSDDIWVPTKLEKQICEYERAKGSDSTEVVVYSSAEIMDEAGRSLGNLWDPSFLKQGDIFQALLVRNFVPCQSVLVKRRLIQEVGGFEASMRYAEDYLLWLRLARGYRFCCVFEPLVRYRVHSGSLTGARFPMRAGHVEALLGIGGELNDSRERRIWSRQILVRTAVAFLTPGDLAARFSLVRKVAGAIGLNQGGT